MDNTTTTPEYLFESSWEVCNKVGGMKGRYLYRPFNKSAYVATIV